MKIFRTAFVLIILAIAATAQQATPVIEFFGGLSINHANLTGSANTTPGIHFSGSYIPFSYFRLTADFAGQFRGTDIFLFDDGEVRTNDYQILFGPEFVFRNDSAITPFVRPMVGWATRRYTLPTGFFNCTGFSCTEERETFLSDSGLALAAGGGVDIAVNSWLSIRGQYDFLRTRMGRQESEFFIDETPFPLLPRWQSQHRFATGVVLRWGER